jgi:serine/threonine protein phosphatase PrpC
MFATVARVASYRSAAEDRAEVFHLGADTILVVADGAGGRPGGAAAAEGVIRCVREHAPSLHRGDPKAWCRLLSEVDGCLQRDPDAGETTAVVLAVSRDGIAGASVGDSEAWLIGPNGYVALTERQHPKPGLGTGMAKPVAFRARSFVGTLLVATDGLFKYADAAAICTAARDADLHAAASRLTELVRRPAGALPDDLALVLCRPMS